MSFAFSRSKTGTPGRHQRMAGTGVGVSAPTPTPARAPGTGGLVPVRAQAPAQRPRQPLPIPMSMSMPMPSASLYSDSRTVVEVYTPYPSIVVAGMDENDEQVFQSARADSDSGLAWLISPSGSDLFVWRGRDVDIEDGDDEAVAGDGAVIIDLDLRHAAERLQDDDHDHDRVDVEEEYVSARLVCAVSGNAGRAGLIVVSQAGWVRYFRDALDPMAGVAEARIPLPNSDVLCVLVEAVDPAGAIVATNDGALYQIEVVGGAALNIRGPLVKPAAYSGGLWGWTGISSILRLAARAASAAESMPRALVPERFEHGRSDAGAGSRPRSRSANANANGEGGGKGRTRTVYLLSENTLQKWNLWARGPGSFSWEMPLKERVLDALIASFEMDDGGSGGVGGGLRVWLCDMQMSTDGLIVLAASTLEEPADDEVATVAYTLFLVDVDELECESEGDGQGQGHGNAQSGVGVAPTQVYPLATLNTSPDYEPEDEYALLEDVKIEIPEGGPMIYVLTSTGIETVMLGDDEDEGGEEDGGGGARRLPLQSMRLIGSASFGGVAVAFPAFPESNLVAMAPAGTVAVADAAASTLRRGVGLGLAADRSVDRDTLDKKTELLSRAFSAYYYSHSHSLSHPRARAAAPITTSADPRACVLVSERLLDERAASDVRWANGRGGGGGGDTVIVMQQLEEKMRRATAFVEFIGQGQKLPLEGRWELMQHGERLAGALGLRQFHNEATPQVSKLLYTAMERVVRARGSVDEHGVMGAVDLFFADVSRIEEVLEILAGVAVKAAQSQTPAQSISDVVGIGGAVATLLQTAREFRTQRCAFYSVPEWVAKAEGLGSSGVSSVPQSWTATPQALAVLSSLIQALHGYGSATRSPETWRLLRALCDLYLDGLRRDAVAKALKAARAVSAGTGAGADHAAAAQRAARVYEDAREEAIRPFMAGLDAQAPSPSPPKHQYQSELARQLAVDHRHYEVLIELCYASKDMDLLNQYAERFGDDGFLARLFQWLQTHGYRADLVSQPESRWAELAEFLIPYKSLAWIHALTCEDYPLASQVMRMHAADEATHLARKKTLLSMAKLAILAADPSPVSVGESAVAVVLKVIDDALYVIRAQETLAPEETVPLSVGELVALCTDNDQSQDQSQDQSRADRIVLAHEIVIKSGSVREDSLEVWRRTVVADDWVGLATRKTNGEADDDDVVDFIHSSLLFHVLKNGPSQPEQVLEVLEAAVVSVELGTGVERALINTAVQMARA